MTPAPSARCPFESFHNYGDDPPQTKARICAKCGKPANAALDARLPQNRGRDYCQHCAQVAPAAGFTPGPWKVDPRYYGHAKDETYISNHERGPIFTILCGTRERKANAQLIAAAPDLYAACEQVLQASEDGGDMEDIDWGMIRAALARANGGGA